MVADILFNYNKDFDSVNGKSRKAFATPGLTSFVNDETHIIFLFSERPFNIPGSDLRS